MENNKSEANIMDIYDKIAAFMGLCILISLASITVIVVWLAYKLIFGGLI